MMVSHLVDRTPPANLRSLLPILQGSCFVLIETARFAATSLLIVLGLPLALFLFVAGWDLGGLFTQLANLSDRYLEADGLRRRCSNCAGGSGMSHPLDLVGERRPFVDTDHHRRAAPVSLVPGTRRHSVETSGRGGHRGDTSMLTVRAYC